MIIAMMGMDGGRSTEQSKVFYKSPFRRWSPYIYSILLYLWKYGMSHGINSPIRTRKEMSKINDQGVCITLMIKYGHECPSNPPSKGKREKDVHIDHRSSRIPTSWWSLDLCSILLCLVCYWFEIYGHAWLWSIIIWQNRTISSWCQFDKSAISFDSILLPSMVQNDDERNWLK